MSTELRRLTTQYVSGEDRIRLSGEDAGGRIHVMWMSQRLLNLVVPAVCNVLGNRAAPDPAREPGRAELLNSLEQQAAQAQLAAQEPVHADPASPAWLVMRLDLAATGSGARLVFHGNGGEQAAVVMPELSLRQWLSILHGQYLLAEWPLRVWPAWVSHPAAAVANPHETLH